uniref:Endonuclease/exonuclease/phosphatase domain-containing protein n=1 Tax=Astatotilapia calliptera TaxID=8154 RepID=A0AAX7URA4_ASTCA
MVLFKNNTSVMMILCNIYAPNMGDPLFYHNVNKIVGEMEGQILLAGDFNEVMDGALDRSSFGSSVGNKTREAVHMLKDDMGLTDVWRLSNPTKREYTFYSVLPTPQ